MTVPASVIVAKKMEATVKAVTGRGPLIGVIKHSKSLLESELAKDMGRDLALSNWRRGRPVRVRVRDDFVRAGGALVGGSDVVAVKITPRPIGPAAVITHGRAAGVSTRRKSRGRRYPASRGKGSWTRGRTRVYSDAPRRFTTEKRKAVVEAFKA